MRSVIADVRDGRSRLLAIRILDNVLVDPVSQCWEWQRALTLGYGRVHVGGRKGRLLLVHRVAFELWVAELVDGLQIDHLCFNRACCNPTHLAQVTPLVNQLRSSPRLTHCQRGHEFTTANTYVYRKIRACRQCRTDRDRARRLAVAA